MLISEQQDGNSSQVVKMC